MDRTDARRLKPLRRVYDQDPKMAIKWLDEQYLAIAARAKQEKPEIHLGDETGLCSDSQHSRSYAPTGKTPAIRLCAKRERINLISSITNEGKVRFIIDKNTMSARMVIKFLECLIKDASCKIYQILDNLGVHNSKILKAWIEDHKDRI